MMIRNDVEFRNWLFGHLRLDLEDLRSRVVAAGHRAGEVAVIAIDVTEPPWSVFARWGERFPGKELELQRSIEVAHETGARVVLASAFPWEFLVELARKVPALDPVVGWRHGIPLIVCAAFGASAFCEPPSPTKSRIRTGYRFTWNNRTGSKRQIRGRS